MSNQECCTGQCPKVKRCEELNASANLGRVVKDITGRQYSGGTFVAKGRIRASDIEVDAGHGGTEHLSYTEVFDANQELFRREGAAQELGNLVSVCEGPVEVSLPGGQTVQICGVDALLPTEQRITLALKQK